MPRHSRPRALQACREIWDPADSAGANPLLLKRELAALRANYAGIPDRRAAALRLSGMTGEELNRISAPSRPRRAASTRPRPALPAPGRRSGCGPVHSRGCRWRRTCGGPGGSGLRGGPGGSSAHAWNLSSELPSGRAFQSDFERLHMLPFRAPV